MLNLSSYNTFGVEALAAKSLIVKSETDLQNCLKQYPDEEFLILGGGSNVLFLSNPSKYVLINEIRGIELVARDKHYAIVAVSGGTNWHETVKWAVENNLGGIENLALIPGTAGAAPVQNIGAYGVEIKDVLEKVEYIDMKSGQKKTMDNASCQFEYRSSLFKKELKSKAFITKIFLSLTTVDHKLSLDYGPLANLAADNKKTNIKSIFEEVIRIRESKLPDPDVLGNAGSFFKNPVIPEQVFFQLKQSFPQIPYYAHSPGHIKIPAGWLVDQAGWKGKRIGDAGCYEKQALVLVNHGRASGKDIYYLASRIKHSVYAKFAISLEEEVNIIT